ncbi:hypothetical protein DMUE_1483 [Dictyocoela muelleri]|nr:hypothetical protein DMUE_1483 [Dictyocoela muelleri]
MEKYIYREFTIKNGIVLNMQSLKFLTKNLFSRQEINIYLKKLLENIKNKKPTITDLKRILEMDNIKTKITNFKLRRRGLAERIKFLKFKLPVEITTIYLLKDEFSYIFGRYTRNKQDLEVLEDESGSIPINLNEFKGDAFVCQGMFICFGGKVHENIFQVSKIIYPSVEDFENQDLPEENTKCDDLNTKELVLNTEKDNLNYKNEFEMNNSKNDVFIFNEFDWDYDKFTVRFNNNVDSFFIFFKTFTIPQLTKFVDFLKNDKPDNSVSSKKSHSNFLLNNFDNEFSKEQKIIKFLEKNKNQVFIIPSVENSSLPIHTFGYELKILSTNPSIISINTPWAFIKNDLFHPKTKGKFIGNNHYYCFFKAYLSQYSLNPYNEHEFTLDKTPNFLICATKHLTFSLDIGKIKVAVLDEYSESQEYLSYSGKMNKFEVFRLI